jgi:hypothetical protein
MRATVASTTQLSRGRNDSLERVNEDSHRLETYGDCAPSLNNYINGSKSNHDL